MNLYKHAQSNNYILCRRTNTKKIGSKGKLGQRYNNRASAFKLERESQSDFPLRGRFAET